MQWYVGTPTNGVLKHVPSERTGFFLCISTNWHVCARAYMHDSFYFIILGIKQN